MGTNIAVSDKIWTRLNNRKTPGDTFNDVLQRLLNENDTDEIDDSNQDWAAEAIETVDWDQLEIVSTEDRVEALTTAVATLIERREMSSIVFKREVMRDSDLDIGERTIRRMCADVTSQLDGVKKVEEGKVLQWSDMSKQH